MQKTATSDLFFNKNFTHKRVFLHLDPNSCWDWTTNAGINLCEHGQATTRP